MFPPAIIGNFVFMAFTVDFDDGLAGGAVKIHDVNADDFLSVKTQAVQLSFFELLPKECFMKYAGAAQFPGVGF